MRFRLRGQTRSSPARSCKRGGSSLPVDERLPACSCVRSRSRRAPANVACVCVHTRGRSRHRAGTCRACKFLCMKLEKWRRVGKPQPLAKLGKVFAPPHPTSKAVVGWNSLALPTTKQMQTLFLLYGDAQTIRIRANIGPFIWATGITLPCFFLFLFWTLA